MADNKFGTKSQEHFENALRILSRDGKEIVSTGKDDDAWYHIEYNGAAINLREVGEPFVCDDILDDEFLEE